MNSWIGIGGNQGDCEIAFNAVWKRLCDHPQIQPIQRSSLYRTAAVGRDAGAAFVNAALEVATDLSPHELLVELQSIEEEQGRVRTIRWGPRTIDLDILFCDELQIRDARLTVPHPAAWHRRFVIDPLVEISPTLRHPELQLTIEQIRSGLLRIPPTVSLPSRDFEEFQSIVGELHQMFSGIVFQRSILDHEYPTFELRTSTASSPVDEVNHIPIIVPAINSPDGRQSWIDFFTATLDQPERHAQW